MNEREFDIRDGKVIDKAGALLKLGRMKSKFPLTPPAAFVDHYAYCKTCFHFDACGHRDADDDMYDMTECERHISVTTPEEFKKKMIAIREEFGEHDEEVCHIRMDVLMSRVLTELGYGDGIHEFVITKKWYA